MLFSPLLLAFLLYVYTITGFIWLWRLILSFVYQSPIQMLFDGICIIHKWVIASHSRMNEWMLFFYCVFYRAVNAIILVDPSADVGTGTEGCWLMAIWLSHTGTSVAKPRFFLRTLGRNSSHRRTRNKWTEQTNIRSKEIVYTECNNQCF